MTRDRAQPTKADILVVDDMPDNLRLLSSLLREQGYKVRNVIGGEFALKAVKLAPPDLILLDILMPDLDGYEVCQRLKESEHTRDIPVIFLSALDGAIDKVKAFAVGGTDYVAKPFQSAEVLARVEHQLKIRKLQKKLTEQNIQLQEEIERTYRSEIALKNLNQELETRVEARTANLKQANIRLQKLEADLEQALAKEKVFSDLKSQIIATISHEYRTPLTTILSSTELLKAYRHKWDESKQKKHFERIQSTVAQMVVMLDDALLLHKAEFEELEFKPVAINLATFFAKITKEFGVKEAIGKYKFTFTASERNITLNADVELVRKILVNLLSNATKFSEKGGEVSVRLFRESDRVILQVTDEGIGIPSEDRDRLFEFFSRGSNIGMIRGMGLGLAIAKKCVDLHSGDMKVESEEGNGTTITVSLPADC